MRCAMPLSSEEQTIFESVRAICIARINICRQLANFIDNATKEEFEKFCHDLFTVEFVFNVVYLLQAGRGIVVPNSLRK
jgi:hypothetical protein